MALTILFLAIFAISLLIFNYKDIFSVLFALLSTATALSALVLILDIYQFSVYRVAWEYSFAVIDARLFLSLNRFLSLSREQIQLVQNSSRFISQLINLIFLYLFGKYRRHNNTQEYKPNLRIYISLLGIILASFIFYLPETGYWIFLAQHVIDTQLGKLFIAFSFVLVIFFTIFRYVLPLIPLIYLIYFYRKGKLTIFFEQVMGLALVLLIQTMLNVIITLEYPMAKWKELLLTGFWRDTDSTMIPIYNLDFLPIISLVLVLCMAFVLIRYQTKNLVTPFGGRTVSKNLRVMQDNMRDILHSEKNIMFNLKILAENALTDFDKPEGKQKLERMVVLCNSHMRSLSHGINSIKEFHIRAMTRDFNDAIDEALKIYPIPKQIKLIRGYSEKPANCRYNHYHVTQVIINLLENAVDALQNVEEPVIKLNLEVSDYRIYFSIEDNGIGIPPKIIKKVQQPYFSTKSKQSNWGIGLSYVARVMKAHLGFLNIANQKRGVKVELLFIHKEDGRKKLWKKSR